MDAFSFTVRSRADLADAVRRFGIVPLFRNSIPGFSVAEHCDPARWFSDAEGVWEWKGPVIRETGCAYGKFFEHKAAFVSRDYDKPEQKSKPEWGINYSLKNAPLLEPYRAENYFSTH